MRHECALVWACRLVYTAVIARGQTVTRPGTRPARCKVVIAIDEHTCSVRVLAVTTTQLSDTEIYSNSTGDTDITNYSTANPITLLHTPTHSPITMAGEERSGQARAVTEDRHNNDGRRELVKVTN